MTIFILGTDKTSGHDVIELLPCGAAESIECVYSRDGSLQLELWPGNASCSVNLKRFNAALVIMTKSDIPNVTQLKTSINDLDFDIIASLADGESFPRLGCPSHLCASILTEKIANY